MEEIKDKANTEKMFDPFSSETAWHVYQKNREVCDCLLQELPSDIEGGVSERVILLKAADIIGRMINNIIFKSLIERYLENRKTVSGEENSQMER